MKPIPTIDIDGVLCKGCGICVDVCKFGVLEMSAERGQQGYLMPRASHPEKCTRCMLCDLSCPDVALEVIG